MAHPAIICTEMLSQLNKISQSSEMSGNAHLTI